MRVSTSRRYVCPFTVTAIVRTSGMHALHRSLVSAFQRAIREHACEMLAVLGGDVCVRHRVELRGFGSRGLERRRGRRLTWERALDLGRPYRCVPQPGYR